MKWYHFIPMYGFEKGLKKLNNASLLAEFMFAYYHIITIFAFIYLIGHLIDKI